MKAIGIIFLSIFLLLSCKNKENDNATRIIFLHHSTGLNIWGTEKSLFTKVAWRINKLYDIIGRRADLPRLFDNYNKVNSTNYQISKKPFPSRKPYGWHNFPYDYYNIWVKNAGEKRYKKQPTLEILTKKYQVIIFKHCYPVSNIQPDSDSTNINSYNKTISNYKEQYLALREKLHTFPNTKFVLFTGAAIVESQTSDDEAIRARDFFYWVKMEWDIPDDNIFLWDLYELETEGGLYLRNEYATSPIDSHPNKYFTNKVSKLLFNRIIDIIENNGSKTLITGESKVGFIQ